MHGMVEAGVDIIELGVPFSTPWPMAPSSKKRANAPLPTA